MDIDKNAKYNSLFKKWKDKLYSYLNESKSKGKKAILVALSRKMPRLIEWMQINMDLELTDCIYLTEHAVPFYFPKIKNKNDYRVFVFDDAIYYGTTLENVASNIKWMIDDKIKIDAIVKKENIKRRFMYSDEPDKEREIDSSFIPYYTSANSENIISLKKPLDMEYPILTIEREGIGALLKNMDIEKHLKECFPEATVYKISHEDSILNSKEKDIHNYTVLLNVSSKEMHYNNDFCKLRFYVSDNHLYIVSYAPNVIDDSFLILDTPLFSQTQFKEVWNKVVEAAEIYSRDRKEGENVLAYDIQRDEYELRRKRSLNVWANYLSSFSSLLSQKECINNFLDKLGINENLTIRRDDLQLILGPLLADEICRLLMEIYVTGPLELFRCPNSREKEIIARYIPEEYVVDYDKRNVSYWFRCNSLSLALSYMFTNQHFHIGLASMIHQPDDFDKLRFGVSYESMYSELSPYFKDENLNEKIHSWIDRKIDEGTVVPKYERIQIDGNYYWKRLFRAGENEDYYVKIARICLYIMSCVEKKTNSFMVNEEDLENLLSIIWKSSVLKKYLRLNDSVFEKETYVTGMSSYFHSLFFVEGKVQVTDFLTQSSYITRKSDETGAQFVVNFNNTTNILLESTSLNEEQERDIDLWVDFYLKYVKMPGNQTLVNNFFQESITTYEQKNNEWLDNFLKWIENNRNYIIMNFISESFIKDFNKKYMGLLEIFFETYLVTDFYNVDKLSDEEKGMLREIEVCDSDKYDEYMDRHLNMQLYTQLLENLLIKEDKDKARKSLDEMHNYELIDESSDEYHILNSYLNNWEIETKKEEARSKVLDCIFSYYR